MSHKPFRDSVLHSMGATLREDKGWQFDLDHLTTIVIYPENDGVFATRELQRIVKTEAGMYQSNDWASLLSAIELITRQEANEEARKKIRHFAESKL